MLCKITLGFTLFLSLCLTALELITPVDIVVKFLSNITYFFKWTKVIESFTNFEKL